MIINVSKLRNERCLKLLVSVHVLSDFLSLIRSHVGLLLRPWSLCLCSPEEVVPGLVAVVVGVADSLSRYVQLGEVAQRDPRPSDGVDDAMTWRHRHRVDQLLWTAHRVRGQQDVGVEDDPLALTQVNGLALQNHVTWRRTGSELE